MERIAINLAVVSRLFKEEIPEPFCLSASKTPSAKNCEVLLELVTFGNWIKFSRATQGPLFAGLFPQSSRNLPKIREQSAPEVLSSARRPPFNHKSHLVLSSPSFSFDRSSNSAIGYRVKIIEKFGPWR